MFAWLKKSFSKSDASSAAGPRAGSAPAGESGRLKQEGDAHLHAGRYQEAACSYRSALAIKADFAKAHCNLAFALNELGQFDEAKRHLQRTLSIDPSIADAHYLLGAIFKNEHDFAPAVQHFERALRLDPNFEIVCQNLCEICFALFDKGEIGLARLTVEKGIALAPGFADFHMYLGNLTLQEGDLSRAKDCYAAASLHRPGFAEAHGNLGGVLLQQGQPDEAAVSLRRALEIKPDYAEAHSNLGSALLRLGQPEEAVASLRRALEIKPDFAEAHFNLGNALLQIGQLEEAETSLRRALKINPDYAEAHCNLGNALQEIGQPDEAVASFRRALKINPDLAEAHNNLGNALHELGQFDEAAASCRRALKIKPDFAEAHGNLGNALLQIGRLDEAVASFRRALEIKPDFAEAHNNLGNALRELGKLEESAASCRRALKIKPDFASARGNLGFTLLTAGQFSEGWQEYEYRFDVISPRKSRPQFSPLPQWVGQNVAPGDRLLILEEQGLGDKLQFARYLALAAERFPGGVSLFVGQPLRSLLRRSFPGVEFLDSVPAEQSAWRWYCPLLSLPLAFDTVSETIPDKTPYLVPDPVRVARWAEKIAALGLPPGTRKIGVVWKPGSGMKIAHLKGLPIEYLAPLFGLPNCAWFNLQKEPDADKISWVSAGKLIDWAGDFGDFDDTAALVANLDLVISVDTSVAHLAGALSTPTWLLNRHASDWRWMREREDSPWYPTMRIFTQKTAGNWDEVVKRMAATLGA
jgi:tetratricopeptide (TPR) repeat protein